MKTPMTCEAFLDEVRLLRSKGYMPAMCPGGAILIISPSGQEHCVITAVAEMRMGELFEVDKFNDAAQRLGLRLRLRVHLAEANDYAEHDAWPRARLRQRLLEALGLTAVTAAPHVVAT